MLVKCMHAVPLQVNPYTYDLEWEGSEAGLPLNRYAAATPPRPRPHVILAGWPGWLAWLAGLAGWPGSHTRPGRGKADPRVFSSGDACGVCSAWVKEQYAGHVLGELPPHIFAVAEHAYRGLLHEGRSQVFVSALSLPCLCPAPALPCSLLLSSALLFCSALFLLCSPLLYSSLFCSARLLSSALFSALSSSPRYSPPPLA